MATYFPAYLAVLCVAVAEHHCIQEQLCLPLNPVHITHPTTTAHVHAAAAPPPPKPTVPVESAADVERRMMEQIAEDRRQKALAGEHKE